MNGLDDLLKLGAILHRPTIHFIEGRDGRMTVAVGYMSIHYHKMYVSSDGDLNFWTKDDELIGSLYFLPTDNFTYTLSEY